MAYGVYVLCSTRVFVRVCMCLSVWCYSVSRNGMERNAMQERSNHEVEENQVIYLSMYACTGVYKILRGARAS